MCSALYKTTILDPFPDHPVISNLSLNTFKKSWLRTPVTAHTHTHKMYIHMMRGKMCFLVVSGGDYIDREEQVQSSLRENSLFHTSSG